MTTIEVDERTLRYAAALGLVWCAPDGVYEFTEKGNTYFREWLDRALAEHEETT